MTDTPTTPTEMATAAAAAATSSPLRRRGAFVLFEGVDRCGKTTQTRLLHERLQASGRAAALLHFPNRTTAIGRAINNYLTAPDATMDDRAIHLLFAANRWEAAAGLEALLQGGTHVIMDRYSYSGVAFSAAKPGLSMDWCWQPELGLPKPDAVIYLDLPVATAASRADFGQERYETTAFQERVRANFATLRDGASPPWHVLDASESIEAIHERVLAIAETCIASSAEAPIGRF